MQSGRVSLIRVLSLDGRVFNISWDVHVDQVRVDAGLESLDHVVHFALLDGEGLSFLHHKILLQLAIHGGAAFAVDVEMSGVVGLLRLAWRGLEVHLTLQNEIVQFSEIEVADFDVLEQKRIVHGIACGVLALVLSVRHQVVHRALDQVYWGVVVLCGVVLSFGLTELHNCGVDLTVPVNCDIAIIIATYLVDHLALLFWFWFAYILFTLQI